MITMSQSTRITPKDNACITDYSEKTVQRVTRLWKQTGLNGNLQTDVVESGFEDARFAKFGCD